MPIQIGLPAEPAWHYAQVEPSTFVAYLSGSEMPDPGEAFLAAQRAFGVEPQSIEPLAIDEPNIAWAFSFRLPWREAFVAVWCEEGEPGQSPNGLAPDARWSISVQSPIDLARAVDDAAALATTAVGSGGARTELLYDPDQHAAYRREMLAEMFPRAFAASGELPLVDESLLFRVELVARDPQQGPYWIVTRGLSRVGKPELEVLEVPAAQVPAAVELLEALAGRFVDDDPPHAGVPYEAGSGLSVALVPALEAIETLSPGAPGDAGDRSRRGLRGPRAAVCAAGKRGSFRPVWMPPSEVLAQLALGEAGLFVSPRSADVAARRAQRTWPKVVAAFEALRVRGAQVVAKVARAGEPGGPEASTRSHVWLTVTEAAPGGGAGHAADSATGALERFELAAIGDWRVLGLSEGTMPKAGASRPDMPREIGPAIADLLPA
jgi:hypothetical protein